MVDAGKRKPGRRTRRLYHSAKISDYQFKKVLWQFTLDHSAAEAASHVRLSANSISAIYAKLRRFFFDYRLFSDPYKGGDPRDGFDVEGYEDIEHLLLTFHLKRVSEKRGQLDSRMDAPDYHFAESNWRFDYHAMKADRGPDLVHKMMFENLLEFIRRFGPVGARRKPGFREWLEGRRLALEQLDRRIVWLERNSTRFRDPSARDELRRMRED
ncbi:hypothetical protein [Nitratireductor sp. StC3]|uniref:hypothetical protein n=1 Tax=Nitratireductor sp. StC3 TaxID=2126741 RepID=UPI000D0D78B0|nr:hypothetical protein [Nitratireductor sp. StC3]PSM16682.1 hypothetical protein C7T96_18565 [Nitratireductor sp. StC3]